jgi:cyanate permease
MLLAWQTGHREDFSCAGGGFAGLVVANGAIAYRRRAPSNTSGDSVRSKDNASLLGTSIYLIVAITTFACIGWMTGIVHQHGEMAGAACGGLGGLILATCVPAIHRLDFLSRHRTLQLAVSILALVSLLGIVWVMYEHELR